MTESDKSSPVLVLGATGNQGGHVAEALFRRNLPVRVMVRDPSSVRAKALSAKGAELVEGDFEDDAALHRAAKGARAVFSMQAAPLVDLDSERRHAAKVIAAAKATGVPQFIQTTVSGTGAFHRSMAGWREGRWNENYWNSKADVQDLVRDADFQFHTILKPALLMENFAQGTAEFLFPDLKNDRFFLTIGEDTKLRLVASRDVGEAAAEAVLNPAKFNAKEVELGAEGLTLTEIATVLSAVTGRDIISQRLTREEALSKGQPEFWIDGQAWYDEVGYPAVPADAEAFGLKLQTLKEWAVQNKAVIASAPLILEAV